MFNRKKRIKELEKENTRLQQELLERKLDNTNYAAIFGRVVENQVIEVVKHKVSPYLEKELAKANNWKADQEKRLKKYSDKEDRNPSVIREMGWASREITELQQKIDFLTRIQKDITEIILDNLK